MRLTPYDHFDLLNKESAVKSTPPPEDRPRSVSTADVRRTLLRVNMSKAAGPDNIPGLTNLHSEPTEPQRMPAPLPSNHTLSSHILKITTPTSEYCLLITSPLWLRKLRNSCIS